jgi:hypothetical protein
MILIFIFLIRQLKLTAIETNINNLLCSKPYALSSELFLNMFPLPDMKEGK